MATVRVTFSVGINGCGFVSVIIEKILSEISFISKLFIMFSMAVSLKAASPPPPRPKLKIGHLAHIGRNGYS